jgi:hypothetical protein
MARIKITDLPKEQKINREMMKAISGGELGGWRSHPQEKYDYHQRKKLTFLTNPWAIGAVVAAAIAIPLAIDDSDDGP